MPDIDIFKNHCITNDLDHKPPEQKAIYRQNPNINIFWKLPIFVIVASMFLAL